MNYGKEAQLSRKPVNQIRDFSMAYAELLASGRQDALVQRAVGATKTMRLVGERMWVIPVVDHSRKILSLGPVVTRSRKKKVALG